MPKFDAFLFLWGRRVALSGGAFLQVGRRVSSRGRRQVERRVSFSGRGVVDAAH